MEEERPNALEMAAQADEERETKETQKVMWEVISLQLSLPKPLNITTNFQGLALMNIYHHQDSCLATDIARVYLTWIVKYEEEAKNGKI